MELDAPAKLNLGLRIVGRRADGYHLLESVFLPLALADAIRIEVRSGDPEVVLRVSGDPPGVPSDATNLAARAARAYLQRSGQRLRVAIALEKRIPPAAGLGGGSSDAGAVLRGLSTLRPGLAAAALFEIAADLGADVPFFLDPHPCRVRGIGDLLEPLSGVPELPVLLLHPGSELATTTVYRVFAATHPASALTPRRAVPTLSPREALAAVRRGRACPALAELLANDLEATACRLCPEITSLRARLEAAGAAAVGLSGSGPTVYGIFADEAGASRAQRRVQAGLRGPERCWLTRTGGSS